MYNPYILYLRKRKLDIALDHSRYFVHLY